MLPIVGSANLLRRGALAARHAIWVTPGRAGFKFDAPPAVGEWLSPNARADSGAAQPALGKPPLAQPTLATTAVTPAAALPVAACQPSLSNAQALADLIRVQAEFRALGHKLARDSNLVD